MSWVCWEQSRAWLIWPIRAQNTTLIIQWEDSIWCLSRTWAPDDDTCVRCETQFLENILTEQIQHQLYEVGLEPHDRLMFFCCRFSIPGSPGPSMPLDTKVRIKLCWTMFPLLLTLLVSGVRGSAPKCNKTPLGQQSYKTWGDNGFKVSVVGSPRLYRPGDAWQKHDKY